MQVGITAINFATSNLYVSMSDLAAARHEDPNKYLIGIGQSKMAVIPSTQDVVTLAANAAVPLMTADHLAKIDLVIVGTESGMDNSKSAAVIVCQLLGIKAHSRAFEIKQACYGATAGLQLANDYVRLHPGREALVIGSDIARYGLHTPGEVTQGGGAVAMIIAADPQIAVINDDAVFVNQDVMDFWRPLYATEALVDGHYSGNIYIDYFQDLLKTYHEEQQRDLNDFEAMAFHLPYTKMGLKALKSALPTVDETKGQDLLAHFEHARELSRQVGNLYTGSLYLSLLSLLVTDDQLAAGDRLGMYSYGSGAQAELYSITLQPGFRQALPASIEANLDKRQAISVAEYEQLFSSALANGPQNQRLSYEADRARFVLTGQLNQQRQYLDREV